MLPFLTLKIDLEQLETSRDKNNKYFKSIRKSGTSTLQDKVGKEFNIEINIYSQALVFMGLTAASANIINNLQKTLKRGFLFSKWLFWVLMRQHVTDRWRPVAKLPHSKNEMM